MSLAPACDVRREHGIMRRKSCLAQRPTLRIESCCVQRAMGIVRRPAYKALRAKGNTRTGRSTERGGPRGRHVRTLGTFAWTSGDFDAETSYCVGAQREARRCRRYGDIVPVNTYERIFAIFAMIVGGALYGKPLWAAACIHTHTHMHTHTHTHTHTRTQARTHACTHTHTYIGARCTVNRCGRPRGAAMLWIDSSRVGTSGH